tara:strand:+ start:163 stop:1080 length:918 start_codon:yes stop_codon:yes gene_type:complete
MAQISIIGTSEIVKEHIKVILANKIRIFGISSTRKKSKKLKNFKKNSYIKNIFEDWKECIKQTAKTKNCSLLIASRNKDTYKILKFALKYNIKIFTEKPVSDTVKNFKNLRKNYSNIFVGYNRTFYENIIYLKKKLRKPNNVLVKCPENFLKDINLNSTHIISIIFYLFGKVRILKKIKNKNSIMVFGKSEKNIPICLLFSLKSSDNFSIEINENKRRYLLKPIEILKIYEKFKITYIRGRKKLKFVKPILIKKISEFEQNNFKPGFYKQMKYFKNVFLNKKKNLKNNILIAENIIQFSNQILKG